MRIRKSRPLDETSFDLTNMIDVVLLLIIFFMLSSQFAQAERRAMDLPREKGEEAASTSEHMVVVDVLGGGEYAVFGTKMDLTELTRAIQKDLRGRTEEKPLDLVVRADRSSPSADVNRLAVALAASGVRSWRLATAGTEAP